jgi:hypothetical protein
MPAGRRSFLQKLVAVAALPSTGTVAIRRPLCLSQIPNYMRIWNLLALHRCLRSAVSAVHFLVAGALAGFKSRVALQVENLALRHQLGVLQRSVKRPRLTPPDRLLWAWLCGAWGNWRSALIIVQPETVIAWHRKGFRLFWRWKSTTANSVVRAFRKTFAN